MASHVGVDGPWFAYSLWPPLKGGDSEEGHHSCQNIVEVELAVLPAAGLDDGVVDLPVLVRDVVTPEKGGKELTVGVSHLPSHLTHQRLPACWVGRD